MSDEELEFKIDIALGVIPTEAIPEYGDLMTLERFIDCCNSGGFIDYDGVGQYATSSRMLSGRRGVFPSEIKEGKIDRRWSHIVWFNR